MKCGKGLFIIGFFILHFVNFLNAQSLVDVDYACNGDGTFDATISYNHVGGRLVYHASPYQNEGRGITSDEQILSEGTYYYLRHLDFVDGETLLGFVTLAG